MLGLFSALKGGAGILGFIGNYWKYLVLLAFIASIAWYHNHLQTTIKNQQNEIIQLEKDKSTLEANVNTLTHEIVMQNATINTLEKTRKQDQAKMLELAKDQRAAREEVLQLKKTFEKHDLNHLSIKKPGLIEKAINKGTDKVLKELEQITDPDFVEGESK